MKTLLLMRHAKSSWDNPAFSDHDRPLNERGQNAAPLMGELIKKEKLLPEIIIASSSKRTTQTMDLFVKASQFTGQKIVNEKLYASNADDYIKIINQIDNQFSSAMVIGHNPTCEELLILLTSERENFPTAAIAAIELPINSWDELDNKTQGSLKHIWRPKELS